MEKLDIKKRNILIIVAVLTLTIGTTLAYIMASLQDEDRGNASVISDTVDILQFEVDKDISLNPNQFNVTEGGDNLSDTAVGSAILRANSTDEDATYNYYVYFQINSNDYVYTTEEQTPEIILTITDPQGNPVTKINGLKYVNGEVSGFDITTKKGLYTVAELYEITSDSSISDTVQEWTFTVSFINLDTNQYENGGKTLEAEVILRRDEYTFADMCIDTNSNTLACHIATQYNEENTESNRIYYHNGSMTMTSTTCTYNGNDVLAFPYGNPSTSSDNCQTVYSFAGMLYDASVIASGLEQGMVEEVSWNSGVCQTSSGIPVYNDDETATSQERCSGYAAIMGDTESVIMTNVGSGTMEIERLALDAADNSYRYSGGDYEIADAYQGTYSKIYEEIIKRYCDGVESTFTNWCSGNSYYTLAYDTKNTQFQTINEALSQAVSDGYITENNVKNYVCFGTDVTPCPEKKLYRIIGIFDGQVKLIKADYATSDELGTNGDYSIRTYTASDYANTYKGNLTTINSYYWNNNTQTNTWSESNLNIVNLNQNFLKNIETEWNNKIASHLWQVGVVNYSTATTVKNAYDYEIGQNSNNDTYLAKIGLMYISDYGYAANPNFWNIRLSSYYNVVSDNWIFMGMDEFPITATDALTSPSVFNIQSNGRLDCSVVTSDSAVRPVFYLNSDVTYVSGTGTQSDPFRIQ